jgi:predicted O-linked N-acetylglucosamine transferase (SPINDLY family)
MPPPRIPSRQPATAFAGPLQQAVALHQSGRLDEAAALYKEVLKQAPGHFDAVHLLGVVALQQGRLDEAETRLRSALEIQPANAPANNNLGTTLMRAGRLDEARTAFEKAVKSKPGDTDALINLGTVLRRLGRPGESVAPLRKAFAANSKSYAVCEQFGASLLDTGDSRGAVAAFEAGVKAEPANAQAWLNLSIAAEREDLGARALQAADIALSRGADVPAARGARGRALAALGRSDEARVELQRAVQLAPRDASAHNNLGAFLRDAGELDAAVETFTRAIALDPALAQAQENLVSALIAAGRAEQALSRGTALAQAHPDSAGSLAAFAGAQFLSNRVEEAVETWRRATSASGAGATEYAGLGLALTAAGHGAEALKAYRRAIELDPQSVSARWAYAMAWPRAIYDSVAEMDDVRRGFARSVQELDAWFTPARVVAGAAAIGSTQPFYLAYQPHDLLPLLKPYGVLCARLSASGAPPPQATSPVLAPPRARKLRLGVVSAQVREHSVWNAITKGWLAHLDPDRFQIHVFHVGRDHDAETERMRRQAFQFEDAPRPDADWARTIVDARCDVLLYPEIGMDPLTTRLASQRLAPVQATSWGHPLTTGLPTLDLFLSSESMEPADGDSHYAETLVRLPGLGVHVEPLAPLSVAPDLAGLGLPADEPLLLCPGTPFKYTPVHDKTWAAIGAGLQQRGAGRLVFFRSHRAGMNERLEKRLREAFSQAGVDFDRTVCLIPSLDRGRFFGLMQRATLMLDTLDFSGFNTALQAMECGLPVVAFEGRFLRGRLASGPLRMLGLDEAVATTPDAFVAAALRLVDDVAARQSLRERLVAGRGRLFRDLAPVRALEAVLVDAVARAVGH